MISLYRPGSSPIHRVPAGWKLLGLALSLALIGFFGKDLVGSIVVAAGVLVLFLLAGLKPIEILMQLWQMKFLLLIVLVPQLIFAGLEKGTYNTVAVFSGILLAALVSLTTKTSDIVELIKRITRSQSFALLIALSINSIALVVGFSKSITEAGLARGVKPNPVRQIVTLFVVSLRYADDHAEALAARGVVV
ncbi:MAG: energy-coupling factor transporter transmembrane protein EcfT [Rhodoluna sp.]|nr:energy-coupling factor transporter transmembrane protein EcfT [Rhodoluna sp.]